MSFLALSSLPTILASFAGSVSRIASTSRMPARFHLLARRVVDVELVERRANGRSVAVAVAAGGGGGGAVAAAAVAVVAGGGVVEGGGVGTGVP